MKLQEAIKGEKYDNINNLAALKKLMKSFKDDSVRTVSIDFGMAYVYEFSSPSKIRYTAVTDSPDAARGYWKKGKLFPFPEKLIIKSQEHDGSGSDR